MASAVLINANTIRPPIAPLGLEYIAETCRRDGIDTRVIDLCFADNAASALEQELSTANPDVVGVTFRNTDTCLMLSHRSFVEPLAELIEQVHGLTRAPVVIGGAGFSSAPEAVLDRSGADYGIIGDGEAAFVDLARAPGFRQTPTDIPGLVWRADDGIRSNPPEWPSLQDQPALQRDTVDIPRYFREGGQIGLETSRGCDRRCIYCADRLGKGNTVRRRSADAVADEIEHLLSRGADVYHLCDSEFNLCEEHVEDVCGEIIRRGLGRQIQWYGYLTPTSMSPGMAQMMRRAGCVGVNFGADSGDDDMLRRLGRDFRRQDVVEAVAACREAGMRVMIDLLVGAPGETPETAARTIEMIQQADPHCAGISLGVRLYPGTPITRQLQSRGPLETLDGILGDALDADLLSPVFYLSPQLGTRQEAVGLLEELIGDDDRFFFGGSGDDRDYDYDENEALVKAIGAGATGAYWNILWKLKSASVGESTEIT